MKTPVRPRKILIPENSALGGSEICFSDERWMAIRKSIPSNLPSDVEERFKTSVSRCCNAYFARVRIVQRGAATAAAIRKGGGKQDAPLDQLEKHLRNAAKALTDVEKMRMFDDRPGLLNNWREIVAKMADDIKGQKDALRKLPTVAINARHELVRSLASACAAAGLEPKTTNRVYDELANKPTWFQQFVAELNDQLLGANGWGAAGSSSRALYSDVLKALRGDRKSGNAQK